MHRLRKGNDMKKKVIKVRDINKNGKKDGFEKARAKGMAKGMGARVELKRYINMKKKPYKRKSPINKIKSETPGEHGVRYKNKLRLDKIRKIGLEK